MIWLGFFNDLAGIFQSLGQSRPLPAICDSRLRTLPRIFKDLLSFAVICWHFSMIRSISTHLPGIGPMSPFNECSDSGHSRRMTDVSGFFLRKLGYSPRYLGFYNDWVILDA